MHYNTALTLAFAASAAAFPGMGGSHMAMAEDLAKRGPSPVAAPASTTVNILGGIESAISTAISDVTNIVDGLLASVEGATNVAASNLRPQPGYTFQAPGPNDSRGPCPGLNLLANYGYLPRNGYVNYEQVLNATSVGFNMGADLATVLAVFAILADGDIATESWYLGTNPNTLVGGLNRHSTVEADVSPNREDYYLGCGDNHHLSSRLFKQNVKIVATSTSKQFDLTNMAAQYSQSASFSKKNNPYLYYFPFPQIVSLGAFAFYPNFFSNGTYGAGGVANYQSISSIIGAQYNVSSGNFEYVPERWPKNWYRRAVEYDAVTALTQAFVDIYPTNVITPAISQVGTSNLNISTVLCDVYMGINSITPLLVAGTEAEIAAASSWALNKLDSAFPAGTFLGCPVNSTSPNFPIYPNGTNTGGPYNPGPSQISWVGNNVYNKTYFTTAPSSVACSH